MYEDVLHAAGFHGFEPTTLDPRGVRIDHSHDVVSGADSSARTVYIDRHIPQFDSRVRNALGQPADLWRLLAEHETEEDRHGGPYAKAHRFATSQEKALANALGVNWKEYEAVINGDLSHIEHEKAKNPPKGALHVDPRSAITRR